MFLRISYAFSILVYSLANFKLSTLDVCQNSHTPSDRLLYDETFAQPYIFAVVSCPDVAQRVFFCRVLTRCPICFAVMNCSVLGDRYNSCSLQ